MRGERRFKIFCRELGWRFLCLFLLVISYIFCRWVDLFKGLGFGCIFM